MKILILAATGRIADRLIPKIVGDNDLVLFGHNVSERLKQYQGEATLVDGDLTAERAVEGAAQGTELAVLNLMAGTEVATHVVNALAKTTCQRLIVTTGHCSPDETNGGKIFADSKLNTTCIYLPWIRDNIASSNYQIVPDNDEENINQVSHEEVAKFIADLIKDPQQYSNAEISIKEA